MFLFAHFVCLLCFFCLIVLFSYFCFLFIHLRISVCICRIYAPSYQPYYAVEIWTWTWTWINVTSCRLRKTIKMANLTTNKHTLPLQDLAEPILFVSARNKSEKDVENHLKSIQPQGSLSGEEVYKFYTSLVTSETQGNEEKKSEKSKSRPGVSVRSRFTSTTKKTESRGSTTEKVLYVGNILFLLKRER